MLLQQPVSHTVSVLHFSVTCPSYLFQIEQHFDLGSIRSIPDAACKAEAWIWSKIHCFGAVRSPVSFQFILTALFVTGFVCGERDLDNTFFFFFF